MIKLIITKKINKKIIISSFVFGLFLSQAANAEF
jgi:hypothetical protein